MPRSHPLLTRPHPVPLFLPLPRPPQESSSPSAAYVEGQYPFDPDMCDIYAMEMCMDGYDIDDSLGDAASSSFMWDELSCKCVARRRRSLHKVDVRRKAYTLAHSE